MDKEECQTYCTNHPNNCEMNIKKYCVNDNIKKTFCTSVLAKDEMAGKHDEVMEKYCNESSNKYDKLCNCKNKEIIFNNYKQLKDDSLRDSLLARPDCFYGPCTSGGVYQLSIDKPCPNLTICQNNIETLNISNSCTGTLTTNCIKIDNNCSTNTNYGTTAVGATSSNNATDASGNNDSEIASNSSTDSTTNDSYSNNIYESILTKLNIFKLSHDQNIYLQTSIIIICYCCCFFCLLMMLLK
jgi:hypothetical protein